MRQTMKTCFWMLLAGTCLGFAQQPAAPDLEQRRGSVETLQRRIAMRQERLDEMAAEIRDRSAKADKKIEDLVTLLAGLKDSQDSMRRVSQIKAEAIGGLKRLIEIYRKERGSTLAKLGNDPEAKKDALTTDLSALDKLVEKRVADIVELVKSMPAGEDVQKYETDGEAYYNGIYYENTRISDAWRQNRRDKVETEKVRREAQAALEKAISDLERRAASVRNASPGTSGVEKQIHEQELAHLDSLLAQRKGQLAEVTAPSDPAEDPASKDEADDLKGLLADARRDIADDVSKTLRLYRDAVAERETIRELRENLAAREKWLKENAPAEEK
jgi:hypothetical protein